jgi:hypothetical protein
MENYIIVVCPTQPSVGCPMGVLKGADESATATYT